MVQKDRHTASKLNIPPSIFPRASRRILSSSSRTVTVKKEMKQTRRREEGAKRVRGTGGGYRKPRGPTTNATAPLSFYNRKAHISQPVSPHAWFPVATPSYSPASPFSLPPPCNRNPYGSPSFPPRLFLSHFAPRLRVLRFPSSDLPPPFFGRSVGEGVWAAGRG